MCSVVGAAGAGREPEREELRKALRAENIATNVVVTTDIDIALAAAFDDGPGIVVSAGTGSVAVGRDRPASGTGSAATAGRWETRAAATPSAARRSAP